MKHIKAHQKAAGCATGTQWRVSLCQGPQASSSICSRPPAIVEASQRPHPHIAENWDCDASLRWVPWPLRGHWAARDLRSTESTPHAWLTCTRPSSDLWWKSGGANPAATIALACRQLCRAVQTIRVHVCVSHFEKHLNRSIHRSLIRPNQNNDNGDAARSRRLPATAHS